MECLHCGGKMVAVNLFSTGDMGRALIKMHGQPPKNKKKREKWMAEARSSALAFSWLNMAFRPRGFKCTECGRQEGFYDAIGRRAFRVEPLPPPSPLIYLRDDVTEEAIRLSKRGKLHMRGRDGKKTLCDKNVLAKSQRLGLAIKPKRDWCKICLRRKEEE